jgi:hypothetical protein
MNQFRSADARAEGHTDLRALRQQVRFAIRGTRREMWRRTARPSPAEGPSILAAENILAWTSPRVLRNRGRSLTNVSQGPIGCRLESPKNLDAQSDHLECYELANGIRPAKM